MSLVMESNEFPSSFPVLLYRHPMSGPQPTIPLSFSLPKGDLMTVNVNLAGLPAIVVPCAHVEVEGGRRLPVGMQLIGRAFKEADLLELAHIYEQTRQL